MSYGSQNELIIFPIIDLIRTEIRKMIKTGDIASEDIQSRAMANNVFSNITSTNNYTKTVNYSNILSMLESNDYDLTMERKDTLFPKRLTGVLIKYSEFLASQITLNRDGSKLAGVTITVVAREPSNNMVSNPLGITADDYIKFVRNGIMWTYLNNTVVHSDSSTDLEKQDAAIRMSQLHVSNDEIRNRYGLKDAQIPKVEELLKYMPNPLAMDDIDYIDYCTAKWIWLNGVNFPGITQSIKDEAHSKAVTLRNKYGIVGETQDFYYLIKYTSYNKDITPIINYPLHPDDLVALYNLKKKITDPATDPSEIQGLQDEKLAVGNKYYIAGWQNSEMTWELLEPHLPKDTTEYTERTILKINISLNYNQGKLEGVKSEIVEGDA
jgi:hypothetical protein